jgi:hypothetical protein
MSVFYPVQSAEDTHWGAFIDVVQGTELLIHTDWEFQQYIKKLNNLLSNMRGEIILKTAAEEDTTDMWITGIMFETEEDLMVFKLTFN